MLARDVEDSPARDDDRQPRCRTEQVEERIARLHDVLEVVEEEQELAVGRPLRDGDLERLFLAFSDSEGVRDRGEHELGRAQGGELHEGDAVGEQTVAVRCEGQRDACLPGAASPHEREKPDVWTLNQSAKVAQLPFATDERRRGRRQTR